MRHIAIIGSGPAGYYTAEAAQKQWGDAVAKGGGNADALYKEFEASIAKHGAGF